MFVELSECSEASAMKIARSVAVAFASLRWKKQSDEVIAHFKRVASHGAAPSRAFPANYREL